MDTARQVLGDSVEYCGNSYGCCEDADALIVATEWSEFRHPNFQKLMLLLKQPLIFDGRNIYDLDSMERRGFEYHSIGRPIVHPANAS